MKTFKILLVLVLCASSFALQAQTTQNVWLKNYNGNLFRFGQQAVSTTTDSAYHNIATVSVGNNESGVIQVTVAGLDSTNGKAVTGSLIARYIKTGGTLTLASSSNVSAVVTDSGLSPATWDISSSSNNIVVRIKGKLGVTIDWIADIRRTSVRQ